MFGQLSIRYANSVQNILAQQMVDVEQCFIELRVEMNWALAILSIPVNKF
jgi:hypothetical protein